MYTSSYFTLRHNRSTKMLSNARPRPSQLMRISAVLSRLVNSVLVNCTPWSVLKISGVAKIKARSSASRQKLVSNVFEISHDKTERLNQSITAKRLDKSPLEADVGNITTPDL